MEIGLPIDHIGIAVTSIEGARPLYERLTGGEGTATVELPEEGVNVAFFGQAELLEPRGATSSLTRFLEKRGPGLHHIAYRVSDLTAELARLRSAGFESVDLEPRIGATGHPIAFLHPRSTGGTLVELVEAPADR